MLKMLTRSAFLIMVPLAAIAVAGCGGLLSTRGLPLTGGSVPVGTSKAVIIVDAGASSGLEADVSMIPSDTTGSRSDSGPIGPIIPPGDAAPTPPSGPTPILPSTPGGTQLGNYRQYTFDNLPAGRYKLKILIPADPSYEKLEWTFDLPGDTTARAIATLWPSSFDASAVDRVQVSPQNITVSPGETVAFTGGALDSSGEPIPYGLSYMLMGDTGELAPPGHYTARRYGKDIMYAWMNGRSASAEINVVP